MSELRNNTTPNRKERRLLMKEHKLSMKQINQHFAQREPEIVDVKIDFMPEGSKVKINLAKMKSKYNKINPEILSFIEENIDTMFTVEFLPNEGSINSSSQRVFLKEQNPEDKDKRIIWDIEDLSMDMDGLMAQIDKEVLETEIEV